MSDTWIVDFAHTNARLDVFLTEKIPGVTRAQLKKRIKEGHFTVNGTAASVHRFLKEGDEIAETKTEDRVEKKRTLRASEMSVTAGPAAPPFAEKDLEILKETADWIVVYKPIGILMHPDHETTKGTLIDAIMAHAPQVAKIGEDPQRPGIVSRLDKDVSGIVVIAKTQHAFDDLKRQFAEHTVTKEYVALVHGDVPKEEGDLKFRIARSTSKARMAARPATGGDDTESQAAWTHYEVTKRFVGATLLRLQILTGRTHQIRAHLHAFGHPVIGDPLYKLRQTKRNITTERVMLQSVKLAFTDPASGERVTFERPLDPAFDSLIRVIAS